MKVLGVDGSPRKYGNTYKLLEVALLAAEEEGAETELVDLYDLEIRPCLGCLSDEPRACGYPCVLDDDMRPLYDAVLRADALVLATPIYWYGPSGRLKDFVDRLTALENMVHHSGYSWVEGKVAGVIAVGNDGGGPHAISTLLLTLIEMGFLIPPWGIAYYAAKGDVLDDEEVVVDAANVGRSVVLAARAVKEVGRWYDPSKERARRLALKARRLAAKRAAEVRAKRARLVNEALKLASEHALR